MVIGKIRMQNRNFKALNSPIGKVVIISIGEYICLKFCNIAEYIHSKSGPIKNTVFGLWQFFFPIYIFYYLFCAVIILFHFNIYARNLNSYSSIKFWNRILSLDKISNHYFFYGFFHFLIWTLAKKKLIKKEEKIYN